MKTKKLNKKLSLKKITISNVGQLDENELNELNAGLNAEQFIRMTNYSQCGTGPATIVPCMCQALSYFRICITRNIHCTFDGRD